MNKKIDELEQPCNANERFLYAVSIRLDAIIHMMSSFMEVYANQNDIATTTNEVKKEFAIETPVVKEEAKIAPKKTRK